MDLSASSTAVAPVISNARAKVVPLGHFGTRWWRCRSTRSWAARIYARRPTSWRRSSPERERAQL